jgi:hypothetical protein
METASEHEYGTRAISNDERGSVVKLVLVTQYPDGDIKAVPMGMEPVKLIVFDHDEIERRLKELGADSSKWNTGSWKDNPSILVERKDGVVILYCKYTGHLHIPGRCYSAGPIVFPLGHKEYLDGAEEFRV